MILVSKDDFSGMFTLARTPFTDTELQAYIDEYEARTICDILGVELGELFIAALADSAPLDSRYITIRDSFILQDTTSCTKKIRESKGMKQILVSVIFYKYVSQTQIKHSQTGVKLNKAETSDVLSVRAAMRFGESKYNESLEWVEAIQWYCETYAAADYPEYNGVEFYPEYSSFL